MVDDRRMAQVARWESEPLPLYGIVGWTGAQGVGVMSAITRLPRSGGGTRQVIMSATVEHRNPDGGSIEVVTYRPDNDMYDTTRTSMPVNAMWLIRSAPQVSASDRRAVAEALAEMGAGRETSLINWEPVTISVDGEATAFELCRFVDDFWCAIGARADVHISLSSRGVPLHGVALVRGDMRLPEPKDLFPRPPALERRFPTGLRTGTAVTAVANVDLTYQDDEMLSGVAAGVPVELRLEVPHYNEATGTLGGDQLVVRWAVADNSTTHPDKTASLQGTFADQPVDLAATFHLEPSSFFHHADIAGRIAGQHLTARIVPASGGFRSSSTIAAEGSSQELR